MLDGLTCDPRDTTHKRIMKYLWGDLQLSAESLSSLQNDRRSLVYAKAPVV